MNRQQNWKQRITVHCLIQNEENWIWYALNSVLDYVDEILVFDTGSTDNTVKIVKAIKSQKILFEEKGNVNAKEYTGLRQEMIERTRDGWVLMIDGDEIYTKEAIAEIRENIEKAGKEKSMLAIRYWNCLGDIFHYDANFEKKTTPICPKNSTGFWTVRGFRKKIPGLHAAGFYGFEGYRDNKNREIATLGESQIIYIKSRYFHTTWLERSKKDREVMQRPGKRRYELGAAFPNDFIYPESFYLEGPEFISSPWKRYSLQERIFSLLINPYVKIKAAIWKILVFPKIKRAVDNQVGDEELARILKIH